MKGKKEEYLIEIPLTPITSNGRHMQNITYQFLQESKMRP